MSQRLRALRKLGEEFERVARAQAERRPAVAEAGRRRPRAWALRMGRWMPSLGTALAVAVALAVAAGALLLLNHGASSSPSSAPVSSSPQTAAEIHQETGYIASAARQARRSAGCRVMPIRQPAFLGGAPNHALISELAVLRTPVGAIDRPPPGLLSGLGGVYRDYMRRALVRDGVSYWVVADRSQRQGVFTPACARRETALLHAELPQIPAALRGPTERLNARLMRLDTGSRRPTDVICLEFHAARTGGGTCGVTAAQIEAGRTLTQEAGNVVGIVPDGVASVTLTAGRPAASDTATVSGNVFVAPARDGRYPRTVEWRSAQGQVIRRINEYREGKAFCRANPGACAASGGFGSESSSSESSTAPQSSQSSQSSQR
ncbi:MAG: hypothetical protein ACRDMJ_14880 [Solirubrobacteraceae bacterium]